MTDIIFKLDKAEIPVVVTITTATACFVTYWFLAYRKDVGRMLLLWISKETLAVYRAAFQKCIGIFWIGVVPLVVFFGLGYDADLLYSLVKVHGGNSLVPLAFFSFLALVFPLISARRPEVQEVYPQLKARVWNQNLVLFNTALWMIYLFAYEFLFRGFLLFINVPLLGVWPALIISCALSVTTHMPKGAAETFGTMLFSVILGLLALQYQTIWAPWIVHVILALSNDYMAIYFNPRLTFVRIARKV